MDWRIVLIIAIVALMLMWALMFSRIMKPKRLHGAAYERMVNNFFGTNGFRPPYHGRFISEYGTRHNNVLLSDFLEGAYRNQQRYIAQYGRRQPWMVVDALLQGQPLETVPETLRSEGETETTKECSANS